MIIGIAVVVFALGVLAMFAYSSVELLLFPPADATLLGQMITLCVMIVGFSPILYELKRVYYDGISDEDEESVLGVLIILYALYLIVYIVRRLELF